MLLFYQQQSVRSSYRVILSEIGVRSKRAPMQSKDLVLAGRVNGLSGGVATIAASSRGDALGKLPSASVLPSSSAGPSIPWPLRFAHRPLRSARQCLREYFLCGDHRIAVDGHGVFDILRIAAGVGHHHGDIAGAGHAEDKFVTLLQSIDR
jgi:hypothetical protein